MFDKMSSNFYIGDFTDGKRNGQGRLLMAEKQEIYDGDWSNDKK